jgi:hypothetical protein
MNLKLISPFSPNKFNDVLRLLLNCEDILQLLPMCINVIEQRIMNFDIKVKVSL